MQVTSKKIKQLGTISTGDQTFCNVYPSSLGLQVVFMEKSNFGSVSYLNTFNACLFNNNYCNNSFNLENQPE